jgi:pullulanase-type alpha-1,6-glucosidase
MGHHPKSTMQKVQEALAGLTLEKDGVDGRNVYIYGEGWNFGEVADNRIFDQATQFMLGGTGIGNFNDRLRDGIRGGNFAGWGTGRAQGFTNGRYLFPNEESTGADADASAGVVSDARGSEQDRAELLSQGDRIRVGLTGNLSRYPYENRFGEQVEGGNEWIGYTRLPQESINYIDKHDNETLWDNTQAKLPLDLPMEERVRVHLLSQAMIHFAQGIPFHQMGSDILRSKSMDRNSFDSGDWYNAVDFTLERSVWGKGLPPAWDNRESWDSQKQFLTQADVVMTPEIRRYAHDVFREHLQIRASSPLFRLRTEEQVMQRVAFHNTGPDQIPGLIVMSLSDGACMGADLDPEAEGLVVIFNASRERVDVTLPEGFSNLEGERGAEDVAATPLLVPLQLHPIQLEGTDPLVKETTVNATTGTISVPGLSSAVLHQPQTGAEQGTFGCW